MSFTELELKDICLDMHQGINTVADKVEYRSKGIPIIQSKNITSGYLDLDDVRYLDIDDYEKYKDKYNPNKGDILLCNIGTIGTSLVLKQDSKFLIAWNLFKLKIDTERFNPKYIKYYLDKLKLINYFDRLLTGGTVKFINKTKMGQIRIPICDIRKQDKIVSVLDKAQELIDKRKEQIEALDELVKSQFIEMFGDPVHNPLGWELKPFLESGSCKNGMNFSANESGIELQYLGVGDFKDLSKIDNVNALGKVSLNQMPSKEYILQDGDIVFVRSNGNKALVGRCLAVYPNGVATTYSGFCIRYRKTDENLEIPYLLQVLKTDSIRKNMAGRGANIQNLNQQILGELMIPVPPLELQKQFTDFIKQVDKLKFEMEKSLKELEDNFNSLIQKAFNGELFN